MAVEGNVFLTRRPRKPLRAAPASPALKRRPELASLNICKSKHQSLFPSPFCPPTSLKDTSAVRNVASCLALTGYACGCLVWLAGWLAGQGSFLAKNNGAVVFCLDGP